MEENTVNAAAFEEFTTVITQLSDLVTALAEIEEQKAVAAAGSRHELINDFLNPEQALILKMRGLEHRRKRLADVLGWSSLTFRQILELTGGDENLRLSPLFMNLSKQVRRLTEAKDSSETIIRLRIKELNTIIAQETGTGYGGNGYSGEPAAVHFRDTYV